MRDSSKLPGARADGPPKMAVQMVKFLVLPVVFLAVLTLMLRQPQRFRWVPDPTVVVSLGFWRGANTGGGSSEDRVDGFTVGPSHYDVLLRTKYQVELLRSLESSLGVEQVARLKEDIMLQAAVSLSLIDGESSSASVKERALKRLTQICDSVSASELSGEKGPSIFQRVAGLFTFVNILWVVGSVLLLIGLTSIITTIIVPFVLAAQILVKIIKAIPIWVYMLLSWVLVFMTITTGYVAVNDLDIGLYFCLPAMLAIPVLQFWGGVHFLPSTGSYKGLLLFSEILHVYSCTCWALLAFFFESKLLAFLVAMGVVSLLGFTIEVFGLSMLIGFPDRDPIPRALFCSILMSSVPILYRANAWSIPSLEPFLLAFTFVPVFVTYISLLIVSSSFYSPRSYGIINLWTVLVIVVYTLIGLYWNIGALFSLSVTFGGIWFLFKFGELPWGKNFLSFGVTGLAILLIGGAMFIRKNPSLVNRMFEV